MRLPQREKCNRCLPSNISGECRHVKQAACVPPVASILISLYTSNGATSCRASPARCLKKNLKKRDWVLCSVPGMFDCKDGLACTVQKERLGGAYVARSIRPNLFASVDAFRVVEKDHYNMPSKFAYCKVN